MNPQKIFFNEYGRLRSGWRFTIFLISYIFFASSITRRICFDFIQFAGRRGTKQPDNIGRNIFDFFGLCDFARLVLREDF